jgi:23S rRNA (adenine1618-N6)-methyltransferase
VGRERLTVHPRNLHVGGYDFHALAHTHPGLQRFIRPNPAGKDSIDFSDPIAIQVFNRALLKHHYQVEGWSIPEGYLCPAIPGRADYIHHLADLLGRTGDNVTVLDIGTGSSAIYPILGRREYGWRFVGTDIDRTALASAQANIDRTPGLSEGIRLRVQVSEKRILEGVIRASDRFDAVMCNPPFHESEEQVRAATRRKWKNLGKEKADEAMRNFGGRAHELWCAGGEEAFIRRMVRESVSFSPQVEWFTSLVAKKNRLDAILNEIKGIGAIDVRVIDMDQGQKSSRMVAWQI